MSDSTINPVTRLSFGRNFAAIATLTGSFLLTGALGSSILYESVRHAPNCNARIALGRAVAFPLAMLFVHYVGYRLWKRQYSPGRSAGLGPGLAVYWDPIRAALVQHAIFFTLAVLALDTGEMLHSTIVAVLAYWMSASLIVARRLDAPTAGDLFFIRWALLAIWLIAVIVGPVVWYRIEY